MALLMYIHVEDEMAEAVNIQDEPSQSRDQIFWLNSSDDLAINIQQSPAPACCKNARCRSTIAKLQLKVRQLQRKVYSHLTFKLLSVSNLVIQCYEVIAHLMCYFMWELLAVRR